MFLYCQPPAMLTQFRKNLAGDAELLDPLRLRRALLAERILGVNDAIRRQDVDLAPLAIELAEVPQQ